MSFFGGWFGGWFGGLFGGGAEPELDTPPTGTTAAEPVVSAVVTVASVTALATASRVTAIISAESIEAHTGPFDRTFDRTFAPLGGFGQVRGTATVENPSAATSNTSPGGEGTAAIPSASAANTTAGGSVSNAPPVSRRRTTFDRTFGSAF